MVLKSGAENLHGIELDSTSNSESFSSLKIAQKIELLSFGFSIFFRLFTNFNQNILTGPTWVTFLQLLDNYVADVKVKEDNTKAEKSEAHAFIDAIMKTEVMKKTEQFLQSKGTSIFFIVLLASLEKISSRLSKWTDKLG